MDKFVASQQYVTKWLLRYDEELFPILYYDVEELAQSISVEVFKQGRSISVYGVRGIGKTALMQAVLWYGLKNSKDDKYLPVNVSVTGANSIAELSQLDNKFYKSVLEGLILSGAIKERYEHIKKLLANYVPWVAAKATDAASFVFPPAFLASAAVKDGVKKLMDKVGIKEPEKLVISKKIDPKYAVDFIAKRLEDKDVHPVFVIDEIDKVPYDAMLSDFFDGHQGWFQGKRTIISLSHTFGQSVEGSAITSLSRFSSVKKVNGVTNLNQFRAILKPRLILGLSQINSNENEVNKMANMIFSDEALEQIVNLYVPNLFLMLESAYRAIEKAKKSKIAQVTPKELDELVGYKISAPTKLESLILNQLAVSKMTPTDLAEELERPTSTISRTLKRLLSKDWIGRIGKGKRAYYYIKQRGEAARHLKK